MTEEEMRRIEAEELAALKAVQEREAEAERTLAAQQYRQEIRAALRPRPFWWPVRWVLPFIPVIGLVLFFTLRPAPPAVQDNTWGGISDSKLMEWCEAEVTARLPMQTLHFPSLADAAGQFTASPDGKRWDGWTQSVSGKRDFSCTFTAAEGSLQVELMQEDDP